MRVQRSAVVGGGAGSGSALLTFGGRYGGSAIGGVTPPATQTLNFIWTANPVVENVTEYKLRVGRTSQNYSTDTVSMGNTTSGSYGVTVGSGAWYFALTAHNATGPSPFSSEVSVTV